MPLAIHFGIRDSEVDVFRNQLIRLIPEGVDVKKHSDTWWSSAYTETMLDEPVHMVVRTMTPMVLINFFASNFANFLVPWSEGDRDGVQIYVTDGSLFPAFDNDYIELRYPG